eukprot:TRINITY_DN58_c0_g3_i1.p1 TRINITY_DN58_c0_g3~~TRINITY_DN58_c0_g3_i1.p1  ORF type:complete len:678 (-),score=180.43 TRINITY_DN58_c0_g3_i1:59-2071(-)
MTTEGLPAVVVTPSAVADEGTTSNSADPAALRRQVSETLSPEMERRASAASGAAGDQTTDNPQIRQEKLMQLRRAMKKSLRACLGKLELFRKQLSQFASEQQALDSMDLCRKLLDAAKILLDFPGAEEPATTDLAKPLDDNDKMELFRRKFDLACADVHSKLANIRDYALSMESFNKAVALAIVVRKLSACFDDFPQPAGEEKSIPSPPTQPLPPLPAQQQQQQQPLDPELRNPHLSSKLLDRNRLTINRALAAQLSAVTDSLRETSKVSLLNERIAELDQPDQYRRRIMQERLATKEEPLVDGLIRTDKGYRIDAGTATAEPSRPLLLLEPAQFALTYCEQFYPREHVNFLARPLDSRESSSPCALSLFWDRRAEHVLCNALVRTKKADTLLKFREPVGRKGTSGETRAEDVLKWFKKAHPQYAQYAFTQVRDHALCEQLREFETKQLLTQFKFGILYATQGQGANEDQMYNNVSGSAGYEDFLLMLGNKIELSGWNRFRAGLDAQGNAATGTHSLYTDWHGFEIMFHVSTFLPYMQNCDQQVERKRHIGNDIVVLVYHDSDTVFDPSCFKSQFNYVFIVVRPDRSAAASGGVTHYRVAAAMRNNVSSFPPYSPHDYSFPRGEYLRDFILTKLVNAELAALKTAEFTSKSAWTRKGNMNRMVQGYCPQV